ncbi:AAA family ATPase [Candidatus Woesearchaeota archaeon]|nr:AAA family ATPase [Candidatus Woesearchaeota archaeon]
MVGVKVAVIGTHSTGKSTVVRNLKRDFLEQGFSVGVVEEVVRRCPYNINEAGDKKTQEWLLENQVLEENNKVKDNDYLICDRSVLDNYAYLSYLINGEDEEFYSRVLEHLKSYDYLVFKRIVSNRIKDDGFRSLNKEFRDKIEEILVEKISSLQNFFKDNNVEVVSLRGDEVTEIVQKITK